jgi:hypothetical protein
VGKLVQLLKLLQFVTESLKLILTEESISKHGASMTISLREIVLLTVATLTPLEQLLLKNVLDSH